MKKICLLAVFLFFQTSFSPETNYFVPYSPPTQDGVIIKTKQ